MAKLPEPTNTPSSTTEIKSQVHRLTNHLQSVLGYMELEDYDKSLVALHETILAMAALAKDLCCVTKEHELIPLEVLLSLRLVSKTTTESTTTSHLEKKKRKSPKSATASAVH